LDIPVRQAMTEKKAGLIQLDDDELQQTLEGLRQLPRKGRSLREVIAHLHAEIQQTLAKGYSYKEMVAFLAERGIAIAEPTLRQYMAATNKTKRNKDTAAKEKTPKSHKSSTPDISKKGEPDEQNIINQRSSDAQNITNQRSAEAQPRHPVGRFVEMPDEL
jgi:hypothetical protein